MIKAFDDTIFNKRIFYKGSNKIMEVNNSVYSTSFQLKVYSSISRNLSINQLDRLKKLVDGELNFRGKTDNIL